MKNIKRFWQLALFPLLYIPYSIINSKFIVNWLGCGCPKVDPNGNMIKSSFNANDFTLSFWGVIACIVIVISLFNTKHINKWSLKALYILLIATISIIIAILFSYSMLWE